MAAGTGPVAVDAERASGYRYTQRAYLVQLRRAGAGTVLIDPLPLRRPARRWTRRWPTPSGCCTPPARTWPAWPSSGMKPRRLFDTELAARLAGFERVGLAALTEQLLGLHAGEAPLGGGLVDPAAAGVLADLRGAGRRAADRPARPAGGRAGPAGQDGVGGARSSRRWWPSADRPPRVRPDPWRRTSGIHRVRGARAQSRVRALWYARDGVAARRDSAPGRVLPDSAIVAAAEHRPEGRARAAAHARLRRPVGAARWPGCGWTRWTRPARCPTTRCR